MMTIMMMALVSVSFVACGDDDDDKGGSGGSASGTSTSEMGIDINVNHCYWIFESQGNESLYGFTFYDFDLESYIKKGEEPRHVNMIQLYVRVDNGSKDALPIGTFKNFMMMIEKDVNYDEEGQEGKYYYGESNTSKNAQVKISKSGSTYSISVTGLDIYSSGRDGESKLEKSGATFSYTGGAENLDDLYKKYGDGDDDDDDDDDDDPVGGSSSFTGNGLTFDYSNPNGSWYANEGAFYFQMFNCDYYRAFEEKNADMLPETIQMMTVGFETNGELKSIPTGQYSPFYVIISSITKQELIQGNNHGTQYAGYSTSPVKISKSGNEYTIEFGRLEFNDNLNGGNKPFTIDGFTWKGTLDKVPDGYFDSGSRFGRLF